MKVYKGAEVQLHSFLNFASWPLYHVERTLVPNAQGAGWGPRDGRDFSTKRIISYLFWESKTGLFNPQHSRYTNCANPAPLPARMDQPTN